MPEYQILNIELETRILEILDDYRFLKYYIPLYNEWVVTGFNEMFLGRNNWKDITISNNYKTLNYFNNKTGYNVDRFEIIHRIESNIYERLQYLYKKYYISANPEHRILWIAEDRNVYKEQAHMKRTSQLFYFHDYKILLKLMKKLIIKQTQSLELIFIIEQADPVIEELN